MNGPLLLALFSFGVWIYLLLFRGFFWLGRERDDAASRGPARWQRVIAIVPARNEADVIARSLGSLVAQDYPGEFRILLVDDQSSDGTADVARALKAPRLSILAGGVRPKGWTGKLWALEQGVQASADEKADYLWFTDADIAHSPDNLRRLIARAEEGNLILVSLMAKLHCESLPERMLIPAFVFFFDMLFPFGWVNRRDRAMAAAAGGCMLVKREAFERAGGTSSIKGEIIDDCALGRGMKRQGPIWLGLTERAVSLRRYDLGDIWRMVVRSAYAQLHYSPPLLAGTLLGLLVTYGVPPLLAIFSTGESRFIGLAAWLAMAVAFQPMLRFYRRSLLWGPALPAIAAFYAACTLSSAILSWRGRGGEWKGRYQAASSA
ncbi:MAG TPA: glycosyltransferase [Stellaceae bacterium]|nr:glycosyltransferase [Stellaceae bacterium]